VIALALLACTEPALLETLEAELAADTVADASPGLRLFVGVAGLVAETCAIDPLNDHVFASASAEALLATTAAIEKDDVTGEFTWEQDGVGLDGADGTLTLEADDERENWSFTYDHGATEVITGTLTLDCDALVPESLVGGSGTRSSEEGKDTLTLIGEAPVTGLLFSPTTARAPDGGQARWARDDDGTKLTLNDASEIDAVAGTWPGLASGRGWEAEVTVPLP
jgi:hypothetical protein